MREGSIMRYGRVVGGVALIMSVVGDVVRG